MWSDTEGNGAKSVSSESRISQKGADVKLTSDDSTTTVASDGRRQAVAGPFDVLLLDVFLWPRRSGIAWWCVRREENDVRL